MNSVQSLMEKKAALEKELAETVKQAEAQKRNLEIQIERERHAEIIKGTQEVQKLMQIYNLSRQDLLTALDTEATRQKANPKPKEDDGSLLSEMRKYYKAL